MTLLLMAEDITSLSLKMIETTLNPLLDDYDYEMENLLLFSQAYRSLDHIVRRLKFAHDDIENKLIEYAEQRKKENK